MCAKESMRGLRWALLRYRDLSWMESESQRGIWAIGEVSLIIRKKEKGRRMGCEMEGGGKPEGFIW